VQGQDGKESGFPNAKGDACERGGQEREQHGRGVGGLDAVGPKDQGQGSGAPDDPDAGSVRDCMEQQWGEGLEEERGGVVKEQNEGDGGIGEE